MTETLRRASLFLGYLRLVPRPSVRVFAADGEAGSAYKWSGAKSAIEVPRHDAHALKLRAMIGRCDGWMGLMESRPSGCYISLRCEMRVGDEVG